MMHNALPYIAAIWLMMGAAAPGQDTAAPPERIPEGARYACPMETHPDRQNPKEQGAYFAAEPGECPWCGMQLKPIEELAWARARRAAEGAEVAYTCPEHQQVFSKAAGECPRCGQPLEPFKVMYTCPDPKHASAVFLQAGKCPEDGRRLVPFRGVWLSEKMAGKNAPPDPAAAETAKFRCPMHPLVHSDREGSCTICAGKLQSADAVASKPEMGIPADARYVCPMQQCEYFAAEPGECPVCGMQIKPIDGVDWASKLVRASASDPSAGYACPMHPQQTSAESGRCAVCGMQLVKVADLPQPRSAPEAVQVQMNHVFEHYLELQQRFAADRTAGAAQQALGLIAAADELQKLQGDADAGLSKDFRDALAELRTAAVKIRSEDLAASRVAFVDLSAALRTMVEQVRPSREKYGRIYTFHCPMSKGDWLQTSEEMKNPYYGFEMLKCGEPVSVR